MAKIYCALISTFFCIQLYAASCCGGGQSASSLITGDHLQEWSLLTLYCSDIGQTNNNGEAMMDAEGNKDHTFTTSVEYKKLLDPRLQLSIGVNYIQKKSKRLSKIETSAGFGDFGTGAFYEFLTNYSYEAWLPRIFAGIKLNIPFGENTFFSKKELRTDIRGVGFYKIDLPIVAVRNDWKLSITPQYLPEQKKLSKTYAFSTASTYTYSFTKQIDLATTLQWSYLAQKKFQSQTLIPGQYWDISISPSWMINSETSVNFSYNDSTIIGKNRNSALYRSFSVGVTVSELL